MAVVYATIKNRITHVPDDVELVCNNPTDVIEIEFDEEWSGKTGYVARFEWNGKYYDVPFEGNRVKVPELSNTTWIMFGVYADNITAVPAKVKCKKSTLCYGDSVRHVPANPFYDEFVERLENVEKAVEHGGGGSGGISEENDPTVPSWAKQPEKPKYTAEEVGAQPKGDYALKSEIPSVPVQSVNGKTGAVQLNSEDVGAASKEEVNRLSEEKADKFTVGEGLQMQDGVLGVVPEGEYELIETITLTEDITSMVRDVILNGVMVLAEFAKGSKTTNAFLQTQFNTSSGLTGGNFIRADGVSSARFNVENKGIYWDLRSNGYVRGWGSGQYYGQGNASDVAFVKDNPVITSLKLYATDGAGVIPSGSVINIWGVRANA